MIIACASHSHAETTYVLIDHSASMAAEATQNDVDVDRAYHFNDLLPDQLVSIAYFGGQNGGDCRSEVIVPVASPKSGLEISEASFQAGGDNPLLSAIEQISSRHDTDGARIIVLSDFDAVCGATHSACMSVFGYQQRYPHLSFQFEPIGLEAKERPLYKCLSTISTLENPSEPRRYSLDVNFSVSQNIDKTSYSLWLVIANFTAALAFMLLLGWIVSMSSRYNARVAGHGKTLVERKFVFEYKNLKVTKTDTLILFLLLVFAVVLALTYANQSELIGGSFEQSMNILNDRFGAGLASTLLVGFFGWVAYTLYNDRLVRLESGFAEKLSALEEETQKNKRDGIVSGIEKTFDEHLRQIQKDKASLEKHESLLTSDNLDGLFSEVLRAANSLWAAIKTSVSVEKPDPWRRASFLNSLGFLSDVRKNAPDLETATSAYAKALEAWNAKTDEIRNRPPKDVHENPQT